MCEHNWPKKGPQSCQNKNVDMSASECVYKHQKRHFSQSYFRREQRNGKCVTREWVMYSPSKEIFFALHVQFLEIQPTRSQVVLVTGSMQKNT